MDFDAMCHYCGEKLPHENCSDARKKPEPTKLQTDFIFEKMQNEIDHLTAELKAKDEVLHKIKSAIEIADAQCRCGTGGIEYGKIFKRIEQALKGE